MSQSFAAGQEESSTLWKLFLSSSLITVQKLVVSHTVCAYAGVPKSFGDIESSPLRLWCGWALETRPTPRVIVPTLVALGQTVRGTGRRFPKIGDAGAWTLGMRAWLTPRNMSLPNVLQCQIWSVKRYKHN